MACPGSEAEAIPNPQPLKGARNSGTTTLRVVGARRSLEPLSDYLLSEIRQVAERPTLDELRARLERRPGMAPSVAPADAVRVERDHR
jgi:hypothetical protein